MCLETWMDDFYTVPSDSPKLKTKAQIIEHSLMKWIGLTPENLKKHNIDDIRGHGIKDEYDDWFDLDADTCSLCYNFYNDEWSNGCKNCPLYQQLGGECSGGEETPYKIWANEADPEPMIDALRKTLETELAKKRT